MGKNLSFIAKNSYYKWLLFLFVQLIFLPVTAQQPYSLIHYDENDLPQTSIGNIQQDETGYLWMDSQFGIVRFDGEKFRVFTTTNLKGLASNRIRLCAKSPDKKIRFVDERNTILTVKSHNQFETVPDKDVRRQLGLPMYTSKRNNYISWLQTGKMSEQALNDYLNYNPEMEF